MKKRMNYRTAALFLAGALMTTVLAGCAGMGILPFSGDRLEQAATLYENARIPVALVNACIIDGNGGTPVEKGTIVFGNRLITAVGPADSVTIPEGYRIIDAAGTWILPGIINTHVHDAFNEKNAELWASSGVTTVRDLSCGGSEIKQAIAFRNEARNDPRLCRILSAGALVTAPFGYQAGYGIAVGSKEETRDRITSEMNDGIDFVKITLQAPSFLQPGGLAPDLAAYVVSLARERKVPVTAHVGTSADLRIALDAGADDIAHVPTDVLPEELINRMADGGIPLGPTFTNWEFSGGIERETILSNVGRFIGAGGKVVLGCEYIASLKRDGPFAGMPVPEFLMMREAGMTPMQILVASTRNAAETCGLGNEIGTLETGKRADMIILTRNPLDDVSALGDVKTVIRDGVIIR